MNMDKDSMDVFISRFLDKFEVIDKKLDRLNNVQSCLEGDKLMDNQDLCLLFKVCHRTLYRYRNEGKLLYIRIHGKIYYRASDVNGFIREHDV